MTCPKVESLKAYQFASLGDYLFSLNLKTEQLIEGVVSKIPHLATQYVGKINRPIKRKK